MFRAKYLLVTPSGERKFIYYGVGQGIGLYSSWALLAALNHTLVRLAAASVGFKNFKDYLVLGDDIVIARKEVALSYKSLLERIGVGISAPKRVFPSTLIGLEFASRLFSEGKDYSPLPVGELLTGGNQGFIQF